MTTLLILVGIVILIVFLVSNYFQRAFITKLFLRDSVCVFGSKGKGKDLLFQFVIHRRKKPYYSNIPYGGKFEPLDLNNLNCGSNTYHNLINGNITKFKGLFDEKKDIYISDCGIYYPSQYFNLLDKMFPSTPLYFALSRHLYQQNIFCNTQALNRVWDKIREHFGYYIKCIDCKVFFNKIVRQKVCVYDRYNDALEDVRPFNAKRKKGSEEVKSAEYQSKQRYGLIREVTIWHILPKDKYDTRYFKNLLLLE